MRCAVGTLVALLVVIPRTSPAQTANRPSNDTRILLDVNVFGVADFLAKDREFQSRAIKFGEIESTFATYSKPSRATTFVGVGGSYRLTRWIDVGASYSRAAQEVGAALKATVPHPTFYGAPVTSTGATTDSLKRREAAVDFFAAVVPIRTSRLELRLAGGPTIFSFKADMVNQVLYAQTYNAALPQQAVTITGFTTTDAKANALGFNVGGDAMYFLTNLVGIGGGVRFGYGTVELEQEPLSKIGQELRVGSTQGFVGLRFRLGR